MSEPDPDDGRRARWRRVEALFAEVIDLPTRERAAHLARATDDAALVTEVLDLVAVSTSAPDAMRELVAREADLLTHEATGVRIGAPLDGYRVIGKLGEGGMGAVYLAEVLAPREVVHEPASPGATRALGRATRAAPGAGRSDAAGPGDDDRPRQVAIKVLLLASAQAIARFVDERRMLAQLDHPGIVRLLDGGKTPTGLPYLVMEHIDGVPITRFVRERGLDVAARLELVLQVCAALQYAHAQRIVHRDIKPSNILVSDDARAHLLDFGIAKLLDPDAAARRLAHTRTGMPLLTPEYASPEQARGESVSAASDIYSLGALLYELLAGAPAVQATNDPLEMLRRICETEPPPPSAVAPEDERGALVGALDDIVGKALHKDPARRYASVDALADDLRRHLAGKPVTTGAARLGPRAPGRLARHRGALLGAGLALVALGGILLALPGQDGGASSPPPGVAPLEAARSQRAGAVPDPVAGPVAVDALRERMIVLQDPDGGTYAVALGSDPHVFYGPRDKDKQLYEQAILQRMADARGGQWNLAIWAPAVPGHQPGNLVRRPGGSYVRWCGDQATPLVEVTGDDARAILATSAFLGNPMVRQPYLIARDDTGTYYFVDALRAEHGGGRHRVFVGPKGAMVQRPLTAVALDPAGDVFATASGELRIVRATPGDGSETVIWIAGDTRTPLARLEPSANLRLVYVELGVYTLTGTMCEDRRR